MSFNDIWGQTRAVERLRAMSAGDKVPSALLFYGPSGVGKRRAAIELAKAINCEKGGADPCGDCPQCVETEKGLHPDVRVVDREYRAATAKDPKGEYRSALSSGNENKMEQFLEKQTSLRIDTIREIRKSMTHKPIFGKHKAGILDDAHEMTVEAANALLKSLEEPGPRSHWILISSQRENMLPTILSRCQPVRFLALESEILKRVLVERCSLAAETAARWSRWAGGSVERALALGRHEAAAASAPWDAPGGAHEFASRLPREAHRAREEAAGLLTLWSLLLRGFWLEDSVGRAEAARTLKNLLRLQGDLKRNASAALVMHVAVLEVQALCRKFSISPLRFTM